LIPPLSPLPVLPPASQKQLSGLLSGLRVWLRQVRALPGLPVAPGLRVLRVQAVPALLRVQQRSRACQLRRGHPACPRAQ